MERGLEQLILFAVIVVAALLDTLVRAIRRRMGKGPGAEDERDGRAVDVEEELPTTDEWRGPEEEYVFTQTEVPPPIVVPAPRRPPSPPARPVRAPAIAAAPVRPSPARHQARRLHLLGTAADVRRAVVIAEILGPCRAFEETGRLRP